MAAIQRVVEGAKRHKGIAQLCEVTLPRRGAGLLDVLDGALPHVFHALATAKGDHQTDQYDISGHALPVSVCVTKMGTTKMGTDLFINRAKPTSPLSLRLENKSVPFLLELPDLGLLRSRAGINPLATMKLLDRLPG
ncbi:hypothetical protein PSH92_03840 [Pseudomonas beijingensis]|uniref:Uncharacterized protein n=1 Tax=Pseudomonas beijingensis TaxID=2954101 RepID=A0ABY9FEM1_9PSED|nr:hypothetical protein [Pseudomonas sp. FP2034]WLH02011.1 hypothetical protein PSH92_03840 [Pseudomonas sp. FP2034]